MRLSCSVIKEFSIKCICICYIVSRRSGYILNDPVVKKFNVRYASIILDHCCSKCNILNAILGIGCSIVYIDLEALLTDGIELDFAVGLAISTIEIISLRSGLLALTLGIYNIVITIYKIDLVIIISFESLTIPVQIAILFTGIALSVYKLNGKYVYQSYKIILLY